MSTAAVVLPRPLVKPLRHPFRWIRQKIALLATLGIGAHVGTLVIVALYYLCFEVYQPFNDAWHHAIPNDGTRHAVRNVGEGLLGGALGQMLIYNAYKKVGLVTRLLDKVLDPVEQFLRLPNRNDDKPLKVWQVAAAPLIVVLYAVPGFIVGDWFMGHVHHVAHNAGAVIQTVHPQVVHHTYWQKIATMDWDQKVIGLFASVFLGRRPIKAFADDAQLWFAERRVKLDKGLRFYHTPVFKARYNDIKARGTAAGVSVMSTKGWQAAFMMGGTVVSLGLAAFGFHVINDIAK